MNEIKFVNVTQDRRTETDRHTKRLKIPVSFLSITFFYVPQCTSIRDFIHWSVGLLVGRSTRRTYWPAWLCFIQSWIWAGCVSLQTTFLPSNPAKIKWAHSPTLWSWWWSWHWQDVMLCLEGKLVFLFFCFFFFCTCAYRTPRSEYSSASVH